MERKIVLRRPLNIQTLIYKLKDEMTNILDDIDEVEITIRIKKKEQNMFLDPKEQPWWMK